MSLSKMGIIHLKNSHKNLVLFPKERKIGTIQPQMNKNRNNTKRIEKIATIQRMVYNNIKSNMVYYKNIIEKIYVYLTIL